MNNLNSQVGNNNQNNQSITKNKPESPWTLIWTGVIVGVIVAVIVGLWHFLF